MSRRPEACHFSALLLVALLGGGLFGRRLLGFSLGARLRRSLFGNGLLWRGLLGGLRRLVSVIGRLRRHLLALRARSNARLVVVGQDLGDAKHRDLVAIAALAAGILAAALLERDDFGSALVLQHFARNGRTSHRRGAEHRRLAANQQNFAKLHDRADVAGDLAYLEALIRRDTVLPA